MFFNESRLKRPAVARFIRHVFQFSRSHRLLPLQAPLVIAVSGGVDSMALALSTTLIRRHFNCEDPILLHINHGTRPSQLNEEKLVREFADFMRLQLVVHKIQDLNKVSSNFEAVARKKRLEIYMEYAKKAYIAQGHHIDDSFEWSLMQRSRSAQAKTSIGIWAKNKKIIRPFMAVTRSQIIRFAKEVELTYLDDPTNNDINFDRNYMRHKIVPLLKEKYPAYLKHYTAQANELSYLFETNLLPKLPHAFLMKRERVAQVYWHKVETPCSWNQSLLKAILYCSQSQRGSLQSQLKKLIKMLEASKYGHLVFSGEIYAYTSYQSVFFSRGKYSFCKKFKSGDFDDYTYEQLESKIAAEISEDVLFGMQRLLICKHTPFINKQKNFPLSLQRVAMDYALRGYNVYLPLQLLKRWNKVKHKIGKINLAFVYARA